MMFVGELGRNHQGYCPPYALGLSGRLERLPTNQIPANNLTSLLLPTSVVD